MRLFCLIRLFYNCNVFASSETEAEQGLKLAELLMAPLLLPCRTNHIKIDMPAPVTITRRRANRIRARPQTSGPMASIRLTPLNQVTSNSFQELKSSGSSDNELSILKPVVFKKKLRQSSWGSQHHEDDEEIPLQDFHEEIEAAVSQSNADACSYLSQRPEMKLLKSEDLFELLQSAFTRFKNSKNSKRLFLELFENIIDGIVPEIHPYDYKKFIILATKQEIPRSLFSVVCKHIKLLSKQSLNEVVRKIDIKYIWEQIERNRIGNLKRFNFMIIEIADNLENSEDLVKLDYVKNILSMTNGEALGTSFAKTLAKVQFIYMTTYLLGALKSIDPQDDNNQMKDAINNLIKIGRNDLKLDTDIILQLMEPVWKVFLRRITPVQAEPFGRFMATLHEIILEQTDDLPFIPSTMTGSEDLYLYVTNNLTNLAQARLKYYRSNRLTKGQLLTLLIAAELVSQTNPEMILVVLASINVNPRSLSESDFESLGPSSRTALKLLFTIPKRFEGEICTPYPELKHSEKISWKLPADLFISDDPGNIAFLLTDVLLNVPRLFLYRVFGLPLMNFAEVGPGMNEIPEMKELLDISNFFLEKWCSNEESHPKVKVVL